MVTSVSNTPNAANAVTASNMPETFNVIDSADTTVNTTANPVHAMDKVTQEQMYNPGLYALPELVNTKSSRRRRHGGFLGFLGRLVVLTALVSGAAVALRKGTSLKYYDVKGKLPEELTLGTKIKCGVAKFGDWVSKFVKDFFHNPKKVKAKAEAKK